jgi:hypothetical protein
MMYDTAQQVEPPPVHAPENERTGLGKKWIKGMGGESV